MDEDSNAKEPNFDQEKEDKHLKDEHRLVQIKGPVYVEESTEREQSAGARRVAKSRQGKREQGLVQAYIPITTAEEIKAAGSFDAWMSKFQPKIPAERVVRINQLILLGRKAEALPGWVRWLLDL